MCAAVIDDADVVVSEDARLDPRFAENPFVTGAIGRVRFYASAPLITPSGITIGRLCVFDEVPRSLNDEQVGVLQVLASRIVDVLELRLRTGQLEQARDELHRSNESLSLFAGQISHDLLQPLTAVLVNAELLALEPAVSGDPEASKLAEATLAAGNRMARLIDTILGYARAGGHLDIAVVALDRVIAEIRDDLQPLLVERGVRLEAEALPEVRADRQQLHLVLQNLIANAIKFTPIETSPVVTISASRDEASWRIIVADNGPGIDEDPRDRAFDLYARGNGKVVGTGIGLATVRRAVEAHGGEVGLDRSPSGGVAAWFTLPD